MSIDRRKFLRSAMLLPAIPAAGSSIFDLLENCVEKIESFKRVRPHDPLWPSLKSWQQLKTAVNGNLVKIESPFVSCATAKDKTACDEVFKSLKNPYYIGDNPALTQTSGWLDAWQSEPSVYAVAAKSTSDVVAAVNFARTHNLRLVVKGGGHSYQGTSNSADSLLIWTRGMNKIELHDSFVADGCAAAQTPKPAVTIESGALWLQAYTEVTTKGGRFVQGGGCTTVGVAGLIQGGGFGSFSKYYGMAAAALLQAEIVTADGSVKIANACTNADLFWALKGGGGGSFGVVTKLTLRTRELPANFGAVFGKIKANSDESYKALLGKVVELYHDKLFNPHWGEQVTFNGNNTVAFSLVSHGLTKEEMTESWQQFEAWVKSKKEYTFEAPLTIIALPAQRMWDVAFLKQYAPNLIETDERADAPVSNIYWGSNKGEAGQFIHAYRSAWLPASLLEEGNRLKLVDALFAASRHWAFALHFNKGLAGAPQEEIAAAKETATNPEVLTAFALAIVAGEGEPAFKNIAGHEPDLKNAHRAAEQINKSSDELLKVAPNAGSYLSESNYFEPNWQKSFWGSNYDKLAAVKKKYDPEGLFFVHHGVGSEGWSDDGFTRL
ncbi:FAD-dependent oxidoreductase [Segetibacter aerophilus]|uniref:FAD-binding protein n=1 Tax=Segetibacter aerophilus TaxID=670293 RepID=A0A512BJY2_9BACT|nr:FAD-binding oxidoreductase [Segetibacter aerophilus]GEO12205.1 FAD-binding protein [Segetibacter aerophilus]